MSEKRYSGDDERSIDMPRSITVPGRAPVSAKLFPGALLRKARDANGVAAGAEDAVSRASSSSGAALPSGVRDRFESSLGADLSSVRVHTGAESAAAASAVGARAYTTGNDIHFADGQYAPADPFGLHLLAHEVAHTQQQAGGAARTQYKLEVSSPGDAAEVEADRAADAMVSGASFAVGGAAPAIHREPEGGAAPAKEGGAPEKEGEKKGGLHFGEYSGSIELPKKKLPGKGKIGPFEIEGEVTGKIVYKKGKQAGTGESRVAGPLVGDAPEKKKEEEGPAVDVEKDKKGLEVELHDKFGQGGFFQPEWNGTADIKKDHIGLQGGFKLEHEWAGHHGDPVKLSLETIQLKILDKDKGEFTPIALSTGAELTVPAFDYTSAKGYHLDVSIVGAVEISLTPNWAEIAKKLAKEAAKDVIEDAAPEVGAGAAGADLAFAAGLLTIPASMIWAWKKGVDQMADREGTSKAGQARVEDIVASAMDGLLGGASSDEIGGSVHDQFNNMCHAGYDKLVRAKKDGGLTIEEFLSEAKKTAREHAAEHKTNFHHQVAPQVAAQYAQAYFDRHKGDWQSSQANLFDAQYIYGNISGADAKSFHPGGGVPAPTVTLKDDRPKGGEPSVNNPMFNDDAKRATFEQVQKDIREGRPKAQADGNRLYKLIQTDHNPKAIDAHSRGMAALQAGQKHENAVTDVDSMFTEGKFAADNYQGAINCFGEGLELYGVKSSS
jgi:hypothetical protein